MVTLLDGLAGRGARRFLVGASILAAVIVLAASGRLLAATIAHWRLEEGAPGTIATGAGTVVDCVGGHNGTPLYSPIYRSLATPTGGTVGLEFNGNNTRVFIPDHQDFVLTGSLTLEAYVYRLCSTGKRSYIVFRGDDRGSYDPYFLGLESDNRVRFGIQSGGPTEPYAEIWSPQSLPANILVHVAGTFDANAGILRIFIDGNQVASSTTSICPLGYLDANYSPGLGIGSTQSGEWKEVFCGIIGEVRISDAALSPTQFLPEPGTLALLGGGTFALIRRRRRR